MPYLTEAGVLASIIIRPGQVNSKFTVTFENHMLERGRFFIFFVPYTVIFAVKNCSATAGIWIELCEK